MPSAHGAHIKYAWQHQPDAVLNQAAPVQNTWYTVLAATEDVRLIFPTFDVLVANETIELEVVVDGNPLTGVQAAVAATVYETFLQGGVADALGIAAYPFTSLYRAFLLEGQNVRVRIRKTTALGAGNLQCWVKWARLLPT